MRLQLPAGERVPGVRREVQAHVRRGGGGAVLRGVIVQFQVLREVPDGLAGPNQVRVSSHGSNCCAVPVTGFTEGLFFLSVCTCVCVCRACFGAQKMGTTDWSWPEKG